mgnify:CR=1 FL=1
MAITCIAVVTAMIMTMVRQMMGTITRHMLRAMCRWLI